MVRRVTDPRTGLPGRSQWLPTIAEVRHACEIEMKPIYDRVERERRESERAHQIEPPKQDRAAVMKRIRAAYPEIFEEPKPAFPDAEARLAALAEESQRKPLKLSDAARKLFRGQQFGNAA